MPKISVVVPVYNAENSIERCVKSILGQSFSDLEVILIEDGAKDNSGMLCDELAAGDARVRVFHKKNEGVSAARNDGIKKAMGEYLLFVDSDDYLPPDYCERLMQAQEEYGEEAFIWCGLSIVSDNNMGSEKKLFYEEAQVSITGLQDVFKHSIRHLLNSPVNKLYHRNVLVENKITMQEDIHIAEDLLFNIHYMEHLEYRTKIVILNDLFYPYVQNGEESLDNKYHPAYYDIHKMVLGELLKFGESVQVPQEDIPLFYQKYWEYMMCALQNYDRADCPLTKKEKVRKKNEILRDAFFQESVKQRKGRMGRGSYYALRSKSYRIYSWYDNLRK